MQVIAVNDKNLAICWDIAIGTNNEFISITPAFACADGAISKGMDGQDCKRRMNGNLSDE